MFVRQKTGRLAGQIIEMPYEAAKSNLALGTVEEVSNEDVQAAGFQLNTGEEPHPDALLAEYVIRPTREGPGFDVVDAGGVPLNGDKPFHNHAAARDWALDHARAARHLPPREGGERRAAGEEGGYDSRTKAELDQIAHDRGVDVSGVRTKADLVAALQRADKVRDALNVGDYDSLTKEELTTVAGQRNVDVSHAKTKADMVDTLKRTSAR